MRIISKSRLTAFWVACSQAEGPEEWYSVTAKAQWGNFIDLKQIYPSADQVKARSGNTVTVSNIGGNKWRLPAAIRYNTKIVYVFSVMTHEESDEDKWKEKF